MPTPLSRRNWFKTTGLLTAGTVLTSWQTLASHPADVRHIRRDGLWMPDEVLERTSVRLLANENPYGPSPKARKALAEAADLGNRYGWAHNAELKKLIAAYEGVKPEEILLGAGSSELLTKAAFAYGIEHRANVISANPTFMTVPVRAQVAGAEWRPVPLTDTYAHDLDAMEAQVDSHTRLVYLCNPNNPTGTLTPHEDLRAFCKRISKRAPVFVDEAYNEFLDDPKAASMVDLIGAGYPVLVAKTFSKVHGMAGLRVGYLMGPQKMIEQVREFGNYEMNLSVASLKAAIASYTDTGFIQDCLAKNTAARNYTVRALREGGHNPIPSHTNFMMFPIRQDTDSFRNKMAEQGVGIRVWKMNNQPYCRVSIGTRAEMEKFVEAVSLVE